MVVFWKSWEQNFSQLFPELAIVQGILEDTRGFVFDHKCKRLMVVVWKSWGQNCPHLFPELAIIFRK
jgi:hypothetical protein